MNVTVWNEYLDEKVKPGAMEQYPDGIHAHIASFLKTDDINVTTATLDMRDCGLSQDVLDNTDVLIWWGHRGHKLVPEEVVDRVQTRVLEGMGLVVLHSGHHSKIFKRLMGTSCNLRWRHDVRERLWVVKPNHPIAEGIPETFTLECEEMYGESFDIPEPQEVVFMGWFSGGEVFRSGCTWVRGNGKIFYFQPGHESNPSLHNEYVKRIITNAVRWCNPVNRKIALKCPNVDPVENC